jgi:perosamine synthetase
MNRFDKNELNAVKRVIEGEKNLSGFTSKFRGGDEVQKFEEEFARYVGVKHALSFNSGTMAIFAAFQSIIKNGKKNRKWKIKNPKIHLPAYTFTADPSAALLANGEVNFGDIDKKTYCMLPPKEKCHISTPTYLLGNAPEKIDFGNAEFSVEDCCQALGTTVNGKMVGSFGDMSIFSFQETKHITTLGEGGMLCSNNEELIKIASAIRNHAEFYLEEDYLGYNFRMTEAQAAFGRVQLKKIEKILKSFRNNAKYVIKKLPIGIEPPHISNKVDHSFLMIGCLYSEKEIGVSRQKFLKRLTENRQHILQKDEKSDIKGINMKSGKLIGTGYAKPLYDVPIYKKMKPKRGCPNVEEIISKSLWMDIHKFKKQNEISEEIDIIKETIKEFQK